MTRKRAQRCAGVWLLVMALALAMHGARADEVRVLAAGAAKHALEQIAPGFEAATGHRMSARFDTVGAQRDRVLRAPPGEGADLVVLSDAALAQLGAAGRVAGPRHVPIGDVVVALAVPAGQPLPDVSSPQALADALRAATSIAYADPARGATAGTHFAGVLRSLQLDEALSDRTTVLPFGVEVVRAVAQGRFALGVSQSSEILQEPGVRFAGGLPAPHGLATGYAAAITRDSPAARALLQWLGGVEARRAFAASGFIARP